MSKLIKISIIKYEFYNNETDMKDISNFISKPNHTDPIVKESTNWDDVFDDAVISAANNLTDIYFEANNLSKKDSDGENWNYLQDKFYKRILKAANNVWNNAEKTFSFWYS